MAEEKRKYYSQTYSTNDRMEEMINFLVDYYGLGGRTSLIHNLVLNNWSQIKGIKQETNEGEQKQN